MTGYETLREQPAPAQMQPQRTAPAGQSARTASRAHRSSRLVRIIMGIACLAVGALAVGWLVGRSFPGTPTAPALTEPASQAAFTDGDSTAYPDLSAQHVVEAPAGKPYVLEGLTGGKLFTLTVEEKTRLGEETLARYIDEFGYVVEYAPFSVTVTGTRAMSMRTFEDLFPHYAVARIENPPDRASVVLVEVSVENLSDSTARIPSCALWSPDLVNLDGAYYLDEGYEAKSDLLSELYGIPQDGFIAYQLPDDWNVLEPYERQTRTIPFLVPESACADLGSLRLAFWDCDTETTYRLCLPDAACAVPAAGAEIRS